MRLCVCVYICVYVCQCVKVDSGDAVRTGQCGRDPRQFVPARDWRG